MKKIIIQALVCLMAALGAYLVRPVPFLYEAGRWFVLPLTGAVTAYILVKKGIDPYLAWIAPPVCLTLGAFMASGGYLPGFGAVLLTAFASVTGAGFGDARARYGRRKRR